MQQMELKVVFPKTLEILGESKLSHITEEFFTELKDQVSSVLMSNDSRWFPVFLKMRGLSDEILEVAEFEYLRYLVRTQDFGKLKNENGTIKLNPSIQFIHLKRAQPKIQRQVGLYCFFKTNASFYELQLALDQALILDLMQEERKYSFDQLMEMALLNSHGVQRSKEQWRATIAELIHLGVLIDK
jgi:hypothetical protein